LTKFTRRCRTIGCNHRFVVYFDISFTVLTFWQTFRRWRRRRGRFSRLCNWSTKHFRLCSEQQKLQHHHSHCFAYSNN